MAGAGNRARQLKPLDFVALCEKSAVRARVHALGVAKSWQAQGIRGFVDVSLERMFLGTQRQAASRAALCRGTQWQAVGIGVGRVARVACMALCHGDCWWACRVGAADTRAGSGWRRVIRIGEEGVVWVAACH